MEVSRFLVAWILACLVLSAAASPIAIRYSSSAQDFGHSILSFAGRDLEKQLATIEIDGQDQFVIEVDLDSNWQRHHLTPTAETYRKYVSGNGFQIVANGLLGLAYVLHDFREHLIFELTASTSFISYSSTKILQSVLERYFNTLPPEPLFTLRTWSEEGQLLAIPDRGFYDSNNISRANTTALLEEAHMLEYEIMPALLRLRMNSITILHSDIEDYVSYDLLPRYLSMAPAIYPRDDPHRSRQVSLLLLLLLLLLFVCVVVGFVCLLLIS